MYRYIFLKTIYSYLRVIFSFFTWIYFCTFFSHISLFYRFATSRHQRSNSGVSTSVNKSGSAFTNSLPRHISLYNNNNDNEESRKENQRYNNSNIEGKFHFPIQQVRANLLSTCITVVCKLTIKNKILWLLFSYFITLIYI